MHLACIHARWDPKETNAIICSDGADILVIKIFVQEWGSGYKTFICWKSKKMDNKLQKEFITARNTLSVKISSVKREEN